MPKQFQYLEQRLADLSSAGRLRELRPYVPNGIHLHGAGGRRLINFGGNDYLGLAAERSVEPVATGSTASALICGWSQSHQELADAIAVLESTESAILFPTGFAACSGTVATLAEENDLVLSDELNHASLIDGCRLSRASVVVYPHRDCGAVEETLRERRHEFQRVWIVTDGVFSMDGHVAPLADLCALAESYDATVIVDEAHGTGVLGEHGSGVCEALGVKDRVHIRIGTLSKAIGSQGGFVAGPAAVIDYLTNRCRSLIFSTALAPAAVAAASEALKLIGNDPNRRHRVQQMAVSLRQQFSVAAGPLESTVPIIPVIVGEDAMAVARSRQLAEQGFFVPAIRPPTVPPGTARLRISVSAAHDSSMIQALAAALS